MAEEMPLRKQILSIPNLMGYFRVLLIPAIVWRYLTADSLRDYHMAALLIGISGITDFLDGFVARRFHMVTKLGKAVDPIADKLTQGAIVLSLSFRYHWMTALVFLFLIKEGFMGIMGILMLRKGKMLNGAQWFGKLCTAVLYAVMFLLILFPDIPMGAANTFIGISGGLMLLSFILYIPIFIRMNRE